jgi:hypothetical protein
VLGEHEQGDIQSVTICKFWYCVRDFAVADSFVSEQIILISVIENKRVRTRQPFSKFRVLKLSFEVSFLSHNTHVNHFTNTLTLPCA